jgi:hypothetical protein
MSTGTGSYVCIDDAMTAAPDAVAFAPPPKVSQLAASHGLGQLLGSRKRANPFADAAGWLIVSMACFAVLYLSDTYLPPGLASSFLQPIQRVAAVVFALFAVIAFAFAIRVLAIGARAYFIYTEGFVYVRNGKAQIAGWSDVTGLKTIHGTRGTPRHYELRLRSGRPVGVPLNTVDGRDPFADQLIVILRRLGKRAEDPHNC